VLLLSDEEPADATMSEAVQVSPSKR
jgi:hypothetical protein